MPSTLNRRSWLVGAAGLAAVALPGISNAQSKIELIYSDTVTESDPRATILKEVFGKGLSADFDFKPYFGATLFKQGTEPVAMQRGNLIWPIWLPSMCKNRSRPGALSRLHMCSVTTCT